MDAKAARKRARGEGSREEGGVLWPPKPGRGPGADSSAEAPFPTHRLRGLEPPNPRFSIRLAIVATSCSFRIWWGERGEGKAGGDRGWGKYFHQGLGPWLSEPVGSRKMLAAQTGLNKPSEAAVSAW